MEDSEPAMLEDGTAEACKDLPSVLHEDILQYCSVPDLCRLRSVCRAWNDLTHQSDFALRARSQELFLFKAPDSLDNNLRVRSEVEILNALRNSWELFDPRTQKFYHISMEFLNSWKREREFDWYRTIGADKGFVCLQWGFPSQELQWRSASQTFMQVANLATGSVVEIPPFPADTGYKYATGAMTVAEDYSSFTVYIAFMCRRRDSQRPFLRFDSQVGEWREFPLPQLQRPRAYTPSHLLKVNETLYTLYWDGLNKKHHLFAFDPARNEWTDTGVNLRYGLVVAQLATALGRLFYVGFVNKARMHLCESQFTGNDVAVVEIDIASGECSIVSILDKTDDAYLLESLDYRYPNARESVLYQSFTYDKNTCTGVTTTVVGCGDVLVLTSCTGKSIAYDFLNNTWSEWRFDETLANHAKVSRLRLGLFGKATTLTLNPVPAVASDKKLE